MTDIKHVSACFGQLKCTESDSWSNRFVILRQLKIFTYLLDQVKGCI